MIPRRALRVFRIVGFMLVVWNVEEVFRSFENGWQYHFFFWEAGFDYWWWWCLLGGVAILLYAWAEVDSS